MSEYESMHHWDDYLRIVLEDARLEAHRALGIHGPHRLGDQLVILDDEVRELYAEMTARESAIGIGPALQVERRVYEEAIQVIGVAARIAAVARRRGPGDPSSKRLTTSYEEGYEVGHDIGHWKGYAAGMAAKEPPAEQIAAECSGVPREGDEDRASARPEDRVGGHQLTVSQILDYYDGPQVIEAKDAIGGHYIGLAIEPNGDEGHFVILGVAPNRLRQFRSGEIDLLDLMTDRPEGFGWFLGTFTEGGVLRLGKMRAGQPDPSMLPEQGFFLDPSSKRLTTQDDNG